MEQRRATGRGVIGGLERAQIERRGRAAVLSFVAAAVSGFFGLGDFASLGEGSRGVLLAVAALSATVAVGALEASEAEGPGKKD